VEYRVLPGQVLYPHFVNVAAFSYLRACQQDFDLDAVRISLWRKVEEKIYIDFLKSQ
jgi:hypothetical protein